ncbi:hypothetical protein KEM52_002111, partial [Ascosphaera acerosa]
ATTLRDYELTRWMATTRRAKSSKSDSPSPSPSPSPPHTNAQPTLLEYYFLSSANPRPAVSVPQTWTLTRHVDDVLATVMRSGPSDLQATSIQCQLIADGNLAAAADFLRFLPRTAWATYVKGRFYLAQSDFGTAAAHFTKASYQLSHGKPQGDLVELSYPLIDAAAANHFYNGLTKYHQHIMHLFESAGALTFVADFAGLALQALSSDPTCPPDSQEHAAARADLLSRLCYASLQSARFDEAWSALAQMADAAAQNAALTALVSTILTSAAGSPGSARTLSCAVETILRLPAVFRPAPALRVDQVLLALADKQAAGQTQLAASANSAEPDYERVLEACRVATHDLAGAAEIAYRRVRRLQRRILAERHGSGEGADADADADADDRKELRRELLALINLLASMTTALAGSYPQCKAATLRRCSGSAAPRSDGGRAAGELAKLAKLAKLQQLRDVFRQLARRGISWSLGSPAGPANDCSDEGARAGTTGSAGSPGGEGGLRLHELSCWTGRSLR